MKSLRHRLHTIVFRQQIRWSHQWSILVLLIIIPLQSCAATPPSTSVSESETMQATLLTGSHQCHLSQSAKIQWIRNKYELGEFLKKMSAHDLNRTAADQIEIQFSREIGLWISMGQQRTGGYQVSLASQSIVVKDQIATIQVNWRTPEKGMIVTQMLTSPCILIKLPTHSYQQLRVIDQNGKLIDTISK